MSKSEISPHTGCRRITLDGSTLALTPIQRGRMAPVVYELTFKGAASAALLPAFEECDVVTDHGVTILQCALPDRAALHGLLNRMRELRLELLDVRPMPRPDP